MTDVRKSLLGAVFGLLSLVACGGDSSSPTPGPDQTSLGLVITLSSSGVSPKSSTVTGNTSVIVVNNDSASHQLASVPNSQQMDCSELNSPVLAPLDQFTATITNRDATCLFNDSLNPNDQNFSGTIVVTSFNPNPGGGNGGY